MKPGARALGVAESYGPGADRSHLGGAVVRADRVVDDFVLASCRVGGLDATDAVQSLWERLDRPDVAHLLLAGIAPAWYNLLDLDDIHGTVDRPVLSVSFEDSPGLENALREEFSGEELDARLSIYGTLPERSPVDVDGGTVYVRAAGCSAERAREVVRAFTPEGGRPEPVRVARLLARAARERANGIESGSS